MFALVICGVFASLFTANTEATKKDSPGYLRNRHDIFIVLDASKYVGTREFHTMKKFLKDFVSQLDVGLAKTHVGVLLANAKKRTKIEINLGQHSSSKALAKAIGRIRRSGRRHPDMARALELVQNKVFTDKGGDRPNVPDVLILFTRRPEPSGLETLLERGALLKSKNVEIITVAMQTTEIPWNFKDELNALASIPQNVISLQSNQLVKLKRKLNRRSKRAMHPSKGCTRKNHNVFFLLDGSGSISLKYFEEMKKFLVKLIEKLDVRPSGTHVGLLQFSDKLKTKIEFKLGEYPRFGDVKRAIERMSYQMGGTETGDALTIVNEKVFPRARAYSANISDIVVIITDGEARDRKLALAEAAKLRSKGVQIMAIGMGEEGTVATFRKDLRSMASKTRDVFTVDFKKLNYLVRAITSEICYARPPRATTCTHQKRDILLIVDGSSSVGHSNMKKVKKFLRKLVMELNIGKRRNHIGLVQFSEALKTRLEFDLDQYYDPQKIKREIRKMNYQLGLTTMTGYALQMANERVFTGRYGDRSHVSDVVILVADGGAHDRTQALTHAAKLKSRGVQIVTVYIPNYSDRNAGKELLQEIASSPSDFYTSNFDDLIYIAASLVKVVCSDNIRAAMDS